VPQTLLWPDPQPLVERLGRDFFLHAPRCPGVYVMRDASDTPVYIGKAKNLRQRLAAYRVGNPDRLPRRHLKLLRTVVRIELEECPDEASALAREAQLLRLLRPRFNRAGTWPGPARFFSWRQSEHGLELAVYSPEAAEGWSAHGPMGAGAMFLRAALARLIWCAIHPKRGPAAMPAGWFAGRHSEITIIPRNRADPMDFGALCGWLEALTRGQIDPLICWIRERTAAQIAPFEIACREADLEVLTKFAGRANLS
jgi:predicted GIY-YIG superfamily endonuclease